MGGGEMNRLKNNRGFSLVEPLMVILIFSIFGFAAFSLIQAGDDAYQRITDNFNSQSGTRVAMGYIQNRIYQNDRENAFSIEPNPLNDTNALKIAGGGPTEEYDIWILWDDGVLLEFYGMSGAVPQRDFCFEIVLLEGFYVNRTDDGQAIEVSIPYTRSEGTEYMDYTFPLKTGQTEGAGG